MSYISEQDTDAPLSRWKFEEISGTAIDDDVTTTRDGTTNGGIALNQAASYVESGLGADFDGASGYVSFGNASGLLNIGTIEAVAEFDTIPATKSPMLFSHAWTNGQVIPLVMGINVGGSAPGLLGIGYYTGSVWATASWSTAPTTGVPYHIVGKYDGSTLKLRVNGVEVASTTVGTLRPASGTVNTTGYIGRRWDLAEFHDGRIWDMAIYASALSDARADAHFQALANPFTDAFASAKQFNIPLSLSGIDTTSWTTEVGETSDMAYTGWATFTPAVSNRYNFDTIGSTFDTLLGIYTGTTVSALTTVAFDDNSGGAGTSKISVDLVGGTQYYIRVGAQPAGSGGLLSFSATQASDARLASEYVQAALIPDTERRLAGQYSQVVIMPDITERRLGALYTQVLITNPRPFQGWGTPVR